MLIKRDGKLHRPKRLASGLYQFRAGTQIDRVVLDCVTSLQNGADMLWIETPTPNVAEIAHMVNRVKKSFQTRSWCTTTAHRSTGL
jgi:isocitrate lyase